MKKSGWIIAGIFAALLLGCAAFMLFAPKGGDAAEIYLDGKLLTRLDLSDVKEPYTLDVGDGNTVLIERGRISMQWASCPDGLCIKQGAATPSKPVVCLPNRVMIVVSGKTGGGVDAVTGGAAA